LNRSETVILEPTPYNYSGNAQYRQMYSGTPYPIGLDPVWQLSENKITFTNSIKMKFAIIIGIIQMGFGVCLSLWNHLYVCLFFLSQQNQFTFLFVRHFNHRHAIYLEFLPQILFLVCIFFYLIVLIFYKWTHYDGSMATDAPALLIRKRELSIEKMFFVFVWFV